MASTDQASVNAPAASGVDIFGAAAKDDKKKEKRIQLKNCDTVAAKSFDPWGVSVIDEMPMEKLWKIAKTGDQYAQFYTELAATSETGGDYRVGIGISRFAGLMLEVIKELESRNDLKQCLVAKVLDKAIKEAKELKPHLTVLNAGKVAFAESKQEKFGGYKKRRLNPVDTKEEHNTTAIENAAKKVWQFIQLGTDSNLRMLMNILSSGGIFFAGQAADKTMRAWANHCEDASEEKFVVGIKARMTATVTTSSASSAPQKERPTGDLFK